MCSSHFEPFSTIEGMNAGFASVRAVSPPLREKENPLRPPLCINWPCINWLEAGFASTSLASTGTFGQGCKGEELLAPGRINQAASTNGPVSQAASARAGGLGPNWLQHFQMPTLSPNAPTLSIPADQISARIALSATQMRSCLPMEAVSLHPHHH